jgi:hypothetical protein
MKLVILAAGKGTRTLGFSNAPKPAIEVSGKSLLEWALFSFHTLRTTGLVRPADLFVVVSPDVVKSSEVTSIARTLGLQLLVTPSETRGPAETASHAVKQLLDLGLTNLEEPIIFSDCDHYVHPGSILRSARLLNAAVSPTVMLLETRKDPLDLSWSFLVDKEGTSPEKFLVEKPKHSGDVNPMFGVIGIYGFSEVGAVLQHFSDSPGHLYGQAKSLYLSDVINQQLGMGADLIVKRIDGFVPLGSTLQIREAIRKNLPSVGLKEYPTLFIDLDGTIVKHDRGYFSENGTFQKEMQILDPQIAITLNNLFDQGCHLVLTTSRPESERSSTVESLSRLKISYDFLVMGLTGGARFLMNDTKPTLVSFPTARSASLFRDSGDLVGVLHNIEQEIGLSILSTFPGESGSTTELLSRGSNSARFIRKTSQPTEDSRNLISYQAHWYRHVGQFLPDAVPRILAECIAGRDSVFSFDMEHLEGLSEFGIALLAADSSDKERMLSSFGNLMLQIYEVHRGPTPTPFTELEIILERKAVPGLEKALHGLGLPLESEHLPMLFNGKVVSNAYPFLASLLSKHERGFRRLQNSTTSFPTLVHGDPTLSNIKVSNSGAVILLDPIGSRVSPGFLYDGFMLGKAHAIWDKARIDLSSRLGYERWSTHTELVGKWSDEVEVRFDASPDISVVSKLDEYWKSWVPESIPVNQLALIITLARILPYKVSAGKEEEAAVLLGFLGDLVDGTDWSSVF